MRHKARPACGGTVGKAHDIDANGRCRNCGQQFLINLPGLRD